MSSSVTTLFHEAERLDNSITEQEYTELGVLIEKIEKLNLTRLNI